jgi:hypothetical protein
MEDRGFDSPWRNWNFPVYLRIILPTALWLLGDSASNRNKYQKSSCGVKNDRRARLTSPPSISWLSRKYKSLDVSQPYRTSRPVAGTALLFFTLFCQTGLWLSSHTRSNSDFRAENRIADSLYGCITGCMIWVQFSARARRFSNCYYTFLIS